MNSANLSVVELAVPPVLNPETISAFSAKLAALDPARTRFLVLRGGSEVFCRGLDLQWIAHQELSDATELTRFSELLTLLHAGPYITLAVVEGETVGGGLGLVAACDFVFATPAAVFALTEGMLGFVPGIILPFLLDKLAPTLIKLMVFTGSKYPAGTLAAWGLVHEVVDAAFLDHRVSEFLLSMKSCKPQAVHTLKPMLSSANGQRQTLIQRGVESLLHHLGRPAVKERLVTLAAYLNP